MTLTTSDLAQPLYYAASTGLPELVRSTLHQTIDIDADVRPHGTALRVASRRGYEKIVRILLNAGAKVNANNPKCYLGSALCAASYSGHEEVVRILLDAGANSNEDNTVEEAARGGSVAIVQLLLHAGANFNTRSSALHGAIKHLGILKMLLDAGVDVDARGRFDSTPLQVAVYYGLDATVRELIAAGADVNACTGQWGSALMTAYTEGHSTIMQMLLHAGALLQESEDPGTDSILYKAAQCGHENALKMLLDAGADVNAQGDRYGHALQAASAYNHEATVRLLLQSGADVNAQGKYFGNALQAASSDREPIIDVSGMPSNNVWLERPTCVDDQLSISLRSPEVTVTLLLQPTKNDRGQKGRHGIILEEIPDRVDQSVLQSLFHVYDKSKEVSCGVAQQTALIEELQFVLETGHWSDDETKYYDEIIEMMGSGRGVSYDLDFAKGQELLVQALLDLGAHVNPSRGEYHPDYRSLPVESGKASASIVRTLIESGANVNEMGGNYGSALQAASRYGHVDIVQLLLEHGADVNAQGGEYGNALQAACASFEEQETLVQMLLDAGANVNAEGGVLGSALQAASYRGSGKIMRVLVDQGAEVNLQSGVYDNALQAACASPKARAELVRMLLDAGADVNVQGGKFGNAVQAVLSKGYRAAVLLCSDDDDDND